MTRRFLAIMLAAALVPFLVGCFGGGTTTVVATPTAEPTATPAGSGPAEQALARYVESMLGKPFVEDCSRAMPGVDVGKICSSFRGERGEMRAYTLGNTFSEVTQWAILQQANGQWNVVHTPAITPDTAGIPGIPWPLTQGAEVVVVGAAPDCLNVREGPALNQAAVDCLPDGTKIKLAAGPTMGDNLQWWQVDGRSGWVASTYLRYPDAAQ